MSGYGSSAVGRVREINEDAILVENGNVGVLLNLYIVADGMGGHLAGEVASKMAVENVKQYLADGTKTDVERDFSEMLVEAVEYANKNIYQRALNDLKMKGMGTTLLAATVKDGTAYIVNVGDSRLYAVNTVSSTIEQVTEDHSYVMELVRKGEITREEAENHPNRNIITRALGTNNSVKADKFVYKLKEGDKLLLCTDGLNNMISDGEMKEICEKYNDNSQIVQNLLIRANEKGGMDNISVILYSV